MHKCAIISDDGQRASARAVSVVLLLSVADTRTGGLCGLLTASVITVLLICTLSSHCWYLRAIQIMPSSYSSRTKTSNEEKKARRLIEQIRLCYQYLNLILSFSFLFFSNRLLVVTSWMLFRVKYLMIWRRDSKLLVSSALHVKGHDSSAYA